MIKLKKNVENFAVKQKVDHSIGVHIVKDKTKTKPPIVLFLGVFLIRATLGPSGPTTPSSASGGAAPRTIQQF